MFVGALAKKKLLIACVILVSITMLGVVLFQAFILNNEPEPEEYTGAVIPTSIITGNPNDSGYQFAGRPSDDPSANVEVFDVSTAVVFSEVTGGTFLILEDDGGWSIEKVIDAATDLVAEGDMAEMMDQTYENVDVTLTSVSIVFGGYTFGIGTSLEGDYIWVAPHESYPTFFTSVHIVGTVMDEESLTQIATDFQTSIFGEIDLQSVIDFAADIGINYMGDDGNFLLVNELEYPGTVSIEGDVIDTLTPTDINKVSDAFKVAGIEWVKDVISNIGEGCALVSESSSTVTDNRFWILLYPLENGFEFNGICRMQVSESSFSLIDFKTNFGISSFSPATSLNFQVKMGIIIGVADDTYVERSVPSLKSAMESASLTQFDAVEVIGYGVVIDLQTITGCIDDVLGVGNTDIGFSSICTFKNPAFVFIIDQNFSMIMGDDISIWDYATICIVPNYQHDASAFRFLEIRGTAYDLSRYFQTTISIFDIPLVIADSYNEVDPDYQNVAVRDLRADNLSYHSIGGADGAFVAFDAKPIGSTLGALLNLAGGLPAMAAKLLPIDLGIYLAFQHDGGNYYYVPVIYLTSGLGESYFGTDSVDIQGMYIDIGYNPDSVDGLLDTVIDITGTERLFPTGFVLAFSLDKISLVMEDAQAIGPEAATERDFEVQYSFDHSLVGRDDVKVELYWSIGGSIFEEWNYLGIDPSPMDGFFPVNYESLDGDATYGWFVRVKDMDHRADNDAPGFWDVRDGETRVNVLSPEPVTNNYPEAPAPGDSIKLHWQMSDDEFFDHYEIFYGYETGFAPSSTNLLSVIDDRSTTQMTVTGTTPGHQYYFIVRVVDLDGFYSDSNERFTRTFANGDSGDAIGSATLVLANTAWTEETSFIFDENDLFMIHLDAGEKLTVNMIGNLLGGGDLYAYGTDGHLITSSLNIGVTEEVQITAGVTGYYYILVNSSTIGTDWYTLWFMVE